MIIKNKNRKTIRVCSKCRTPLIWTFAFDYKERYCLTCGTSGGMLGTGDDVPVTRELIFKQRLVNAIWNVIYSRKGLCPISSQRCGCKKCNGNEKHYEHLSKAEIEWDKIARKYLNKVKGII